MTNSDKFKHLFGIYATELWAMPENNFLEWLNADAQDMPTAERKTGKWIEYDNSHCECPFCHTEWSYFDNEVEHFDFCPRCGAKMEAET